MARKYITAVRVKRLRKERRVVVVHPRKRTVQLDGFQNYHITKGELAKLKA